MVSVGANLQSWAIMEAHRRSKMVWTLAGLLLAAACSDPAEKYDSFVDRSQSLRDEAAAATNTPVVGSLADISGEFLLSLGTNLSVTLQFLATTTMTVAEDGKSGSLDL